MDNAKIKEIIGMKIMMVESIIGYTFPSDFKDYYKSLDDIRINKEVSIDDNKKMLRYFYSMDAESKLYLVKYLNFDSKYNTVLIPFAEFEFGDLLCFDKNTNFIFLYNHEEDKIIKVCENFSEFIKVYLTD